MRGMFLFFVLLNKKRSMVFDELAAGKIARELVERSIYYDQGFTLLQKTKIDLATMEEVVLFNRMRCE